MDSLPQRKPPERTDRPRLRRTIWFLLAALLVLVLVPYALVPLYRFIEPVSTVMVWRWATGARVERIVVPLDRIAPVLARSVVAAEDDLFCTHHGIDFGELRRVVKQEEEGAARPRGGSSITQQLAKNLFLWPGRSYVRKALEFPLALWIDLVIPKRRQLEIYLNVAQWGPDGEFGAEAAARRDFGKPAAALTPAQAALLAAALPNPLRRNPKQPSPGVRRLASIYMARAARAAEATGEGDIDRCLRQGRPS